MNANAKELAEKFKTAQANPIRLIMPSANALKPRCPAHDDEFNECCTFSY